jgi:amino acid transporter
LIGGAILINAHQAGAVAHSVAAQVREGAADPSLGWLGMLMILLTAYSLGGGTYTGLEAVSNSMPVIREPRVQNAKRTMLYMAISLSFTAGGLILAYLLLNISPEPDKTMNYSLTRTFLAEIGLGATLAGGLLLAVTLLSESALLVVGAQAGFIDGPRVLGYMAHDSWMPRWFSNLSERLATQNGIVLMGISALAAVWFTRGDVNALVHIYSINVFITFSLSMIGMCRHWWQLRGRNPLWRRRLALFLVGAALCLAILCTTSALKFRQGGWIPLTITASLVGVAYAVRNYYRKVEGRLRVIDQTLRQLPITGQPTDAPPDPSQPTAVILVGGYSGLGIHTMLNVIRFAPNYFKNFVFISVGVVDTGNFKGSGAVDDLRLHTEETLRRYVELARRMGIPAASYMAIGTDAVDDLEQLCLAAAKDYPKSTVFAGQLVFEKDTWLHRLLHNQTAYSLQRRLQWIGLPMVILPTRVR